MRLRNPRDLASSLIVFAAGLFFIIHGLSYPLGTTMRMGAGFYPVLLGIIAVLLAALLLVPALTREGHIDAFAGRPFAAVSASVAGFALTLPVAGLAPAVVVTVLISAVADRTARPLSTLVLATALVVGSWLIFMKGLGMPFYLFRNPF